MDLTLRGQECGTWVHVTGGFCRADSQRRLPRILPCTVDRTIALVRLLTAFCEGWFPHHLGVINSRGRAEFSLATFHTGHLEAITQQCHEIPLEHVQVFVGFGKLRTQTPIWRPLKRDLKRTGGHIQWCA